jgi:hypothetical protein
MLREIMPLSSCVSILCVVLLLLSVGSPVNLWAEAGRSSRRAPSSQKAIGRRMTDTSGASPQASSRAGITLKENRLSVDIRDRDIRTVIESIVDQGGIDVRHIEGLPETRISVRFDALPLVEGLKRLFRTADLPGYVLITNTQDGQIRVQRILFLAAQEGNRGSIRPSRSATTARGRSTPPLPPPSRPAEKADEDGTTEDRSVFEDIKRNTTARRLLSQLVHPNEQVRERALERLIRVVGSDDKQAELLEFLEPIMEELASDDKAERDEARTEIRKLLRR